jgi:hypothetical protein
VLDEEVDEYADHVKRQFFKRLQMAVADNKQKPQMDFSVDVVGDAVEAFLLELMKHFAFLHLLQQRGHQTQAKLRLCFDSVSIDHVETVRLSQFLPQIYAVAILGEFLYHLDIVLIPGLFGNCGYLSEQFHLFFFLCFIEGEF